MKVLKLKTRGILIKVITHYLSEESSTLENHQYFTYRVTVWNENPFAVTILGRSWEVVDRPGGCVECHNPDQGIYGKQEYLLPNRYFEFEGYHANDFGIGKMTGRFYLRNEDSGEKFTVQLPVIEFYADRLICN